MTKEELKKQALDYHQTQGQEKIELSQVKRPQALVIYLSHTLLVWRAL